MYEDLVYVNSSYLISLKPKRYILPIITLGLMLILLIVGFYYKTYDTKVTTGYITCEENCYLDIKVTLDLVSKLSNAEFIELDNKKINVLNREISEILVDKNSNINYQIIKYELDTKELESLFYKVKLYYDKDLIIKKIINIFLESD